MFVLLCPSECLLKSFFLLLGAFKNRMPHWLLNVWIFHKSDWWFSSVLEVQQPSSLLAICLFCLIDGFRPVSWHYSERIFLCKIITSVLRRVGVRQTRMLYERSTEGHKLHIKQQIPVQSTEIKVRHLTWRTEKCWRCKTKQRQRGKVFPKTSNKFEMFHRVAHHAPDLEACVV